MRNQTAKKIRKEADGLEVGGTPMWRKVYRQLKKEHKMERQAHTTVIALKKRKKPANTAMSTAKPKKKVKTT